MQTKAQTPEHEYGVRAGLARARHGVCLKPCGHVAGETRLSDRIWQYHVSALVLNGLHRQSCMKRKGFVARFSRHICGSGPHFPSPGRCWLRGGIPRCSIVETGTGRDRLALAPSEQIPDDGEPDVIHDVMRGSSMPTIADAKTGQFGFLAQAGPPAIVGRARPPLPARVGPSGAAARHSGLSRPRRHTTGLRRSLTMLAQAVRTCLCGLVSLADGGQRGVQDTERTVVRAGPIRANVSGGCKDVPVRVAGRYRSTYGTCRPDHLWKHGK